MRPVLPRKIERIIVPPIKCQGIKTKLIPFIAENIAWQGDGKWIEPFLGSGVVAFNVAPSRAILCDSNRHIIRFYQALQNSEIDSGMVREFLQHEGDKLKKHGKEYYYEVRDRFNRDAASLDFLFLNRSCFNGLMRFNGKGGFNVPFGHKPERFSKAYITKIVNQVERVTNLIKMNDWEFAVADWRETFTKAQSGDLVYLDPPYIGRHADYFNQWDQTEADSLANAAAALPCEYALSMWLENSYRKNDHIEEQWQKTKIKLYSHFYHVGSLEEYRNQITEALVLRSISSVYSLT